MSCRFWFQGLSFCLWRINFGGCFQYRDNRQDHNGLNEDKYSASEVDLIEESCADACGEGSQIEGQDGLGVGEAEFS